MLTQFSQFDNTNLSHPNSMSTYTLAARQTYRQWISPNQCCCCSSASSSAFCSASNLSRSAFCLIFINISLSKSLLAPPNAGPPDGKLLALKLLKPGDLPLLAFPPVAHSNAHYDLPLQLFSLCSLPSPCSWFPVIWQRYKKVPDVR